MIHKFTKEVKPEQIGEMECEMGEWIVDLVDISLQINRIDSIKEQIEELFTTKYPNVYKEFLNTNSNEDITEFIGTDGMREELGISLSDYYTMMSDIYNLTPEFKLLFKKKWEDYMS
jgi:hypothetical protein